MRVVKAALLGSIVVSLVMIWVVKDAVTEAYQAKPNTLELRLSGVDLAVARSEVDPSPYTIPAAPNTRRSPLPAVSPAVSTGGAVEFPPVAMDGGGSQLRGTVVGPEGPIADAVVGIQRHTSHGIGSLRVTTDAGGNWSVGGLPGGRYRIRAWLPGLMTMTGSEVMFLADDQTTDFSFSLWGVDPQPTLDLVHSGPIYDGLSATVAVAISRRSVDLDGVLVTNPVVGAAVAVQVSREMTLASSPIQFTDQQGAARFVLACVPAVAAPPTGNPIVGSTGNPTVDPTGKPAGDPTGNPTGHPLLTARLGTVAASFALPGCQPLPAEPVVDPSTGAVDG